MPRSLATVLLLLFAALCMCEDSVVQVEVGKTWTVSSRDNSSIVPFETEQKYIHSALYKQKLIPDPLYRFGDTDLRWIALSRWEMSTTIDVRPLKNKAYVELYVDGADTFVTFKLGGIIVGKTKNQHLKYFFDITKIAHSGEDFLPLVLEFDSAITGADELASSYPYAVPPPSNFTEKEVHGAGARQFVRKAQCDFGWDWGPCFSPMGILRGVYVQAYDTAIIRDVTWEAVRKREWEEERVGEDRSSRRDASAWDAVIHVFFYSFSDRVVEGDVRVHLLQACKHYRDDREPCEEISLNHHVKLQRGINDITVNITVNNPYLWWVREVGAPNLNDLSVTWRGHNAETHSRTLKVGIREVKMIEENIAGGLSFFLRVNGRRIFAKGTNVVPLHPLHDMATSDYLRGIVMATVQANNNILRVWGGGIYQQDLFYQIADEQGILVWQEFMFACAMYPTSQDFLSDVESEIRSQMRRLKHHASVVLWGGNNENEQALVQNWYGTSANFELYKEDYLKLYVDLMKRVVEEEGPYEIFLVSSPSNGKEEEKEGFVSKNPQSEYFGDVHYYNYAADCWNTSTYLVPRMASEYGVQSLPSLITLKNSAEDQDLSLFSELMKHRQHHPLGNAQLQAQISRHFPSSDSFDHTIYLSQLAQAMCVRFETEHYRRFFDHFDNLNRGMTSGSLYWQLNDIWAAPSWSSIEIGNRWKILHHYIQHIYSPILASPLEENGLLRIFGVHDEHWKLSSPITLEIQTWRWDSGLVHSSKHDIGSLPPSSSTVVFEIEMSQLLQQYSREEIVFVIRFLNKHNHQEELCRNIHYPIPLKFATGLQNPHLNVRVLPQTSSNGNVQIGLTADQVPAAFVWIETEASGHFSDNAFLLTEKYRVIEFIPHEPNQTADLVQKTLRVRSLFDVLV